MTKEKMKMFGMKRCVWLHKEFFFFFLFGSQIGERKTISVSGKKNRKVSEDNIPRLL